MIKQATLTTILLSFFTNITHSQVVPELYDIERDSLLHSLPYDMLQIGSSSETFIGFSVSFDKNNWKVYYTNNKSPLWIKTIKNNKASFIFFKVCTGEKRNCVNYKLTTTNRYRIYWNKEKQKWDLFKILIE